MNNRSGRRHPRSLDGKSSEHRADLIAAFSLAATIFFGIEAMGSENLTPEIDPGQSTGQVCESFYKEMGALTEAGLSVEGLAQIEDPRESTCGHAHTVPYVWNISSQVGDENPEEIQQNEDATAPGE